ncbi:hypothetical protein UAW_03237 [Enterococcus haemoperoxidus ATCC BAA-382]|uniref:Uncharacterized protein n=1 Tax=Enterococcus haemoperoxidus ATCC BAA-382 TaxID=1158608 RepID=R2Q6V2_9ENTE|nr:hypothetical protein UAW_03237 [Enterococcus haemoperoxidus ATCC BAA-382]EOT61937.1 hypothetical protein I583_00920 [Enterococcus haemoperoxidus ATCC BAA-382]
MKKIVKVLGILVGSLLVVVFLVFVGIYTNNKIQLQNKTKKLFLMVKKWKWITNLYVFK